MTQEKIRRILEDIHQPHLMAGIDQLSVSDLNAFLLELTQYVPWLPEQRALLLPKSSSALRASPCVNYTEKGNLEDRQRGEALLKKGKVGCLILAGGQGTRLGFEGPKGMALVTENPAKSLFQLFFERTLEARKQSRSDLPLCIMTSALNHDETSSYFKHNDYFGLSGANVSLFKQHNLPFIDQKGNWMLKAPGILAQGPDGNGNALHLFFKSGLWKQWVEKGIEYLNIIFVDNALADPFDTEFVGFTQRKGLDAALKAVTRKSPDEPMGAIVEIEGKMRVIEYTELPPHPERFHLSSTGMFCVSLRFIQFLSESSNAPFPLHLNHKIAEVWDPQFPFPHRLKKQLGKCERFLFDLLKVTSSSAAFVCPREQIFAPLKNATGKDSLETVKLSLQEYDKLFKG